ncbi:MAG: hypothetical protein OHK0046_44170 [Anaerolineae bacterium]
MTIQISWDDDVTYSTLRYDFNGMWSWDDFARVNRTAFGMIRKIHHQVNVIFNLEHSSDFPVGALDAIQRMLAVAPSNLGLIVVANPDSLAEYSFRMLSKFDDDLGARLVMAETIELAQDTITSYKLSMASGY